MTFAGPLRPPIVSDLDAIVQATRQLRAGGFERATTARAPEHRTASATTVEALMAEATEMARRDPSMSKEQIFARLLKSDKRVYAEYLAAHPEQTGRR